MAIETYTKYAKQAKSAINAGEFAEASELYVQSAGHRITTYIDTSETDESNLNLIFSDLLAATIYAAKSNRQTDAEAIALLCSSISPLVVHRSAYRETEGLAHEITGDCFFVAGSDKAIAEYERAGEIYRKMEHDDRLHWSTEPEFEEAYRTFKAHIESIGKEVPERVNSGTPLRMDFLGRIEYKKNLAEGLSRS